LYDGKRLHTVVDQILYLGELAKKVPGFNGPHCGWGAAAVPSAPPQMAPQAAMPPPPSLAPPDEEAPDDMPDDDDLDAELEKAMKMASHIDQQALPELPQLPAALPPPPNTAMPPPPSIAGPPTDDLPGPPPPPPDGFSEDDDASSLEEDSGNTATLRHCFMALRSMTHCTDASTWPQLTLISPLSPYCMGHNRR
jgi:hypothetical protein